MDTDPDNPHMWIVVCGLAVFLMGLVCLFIDWRREGKTTRMIRLLPWEPGWVAFGIFIWFLVTLPFLVQSLVLSGMALIEPMLVGDRETWVLVFGGYSLHMTLLLLVWLGFRLYPENFHINLNPVRTRMLAALGWGVFYFLAAIPLVALTAFVWTTLLGALEHLGFPLDVRPQEMVRTFGQLEHLAPLMILLLLALVVAPISEELVFRGLIYRFFKNGFSERTAMAVSSLLFALIHANLLSFVPLFLLGMLICRAYERTGSLWVAIFFHACFNLNTTLFLLAGLQPA